MIPADETDTGTPVDTGDGLLVTPSSLWAGVFVHADLHAYVTGLVAVTVTRTALGVTQIVRGMDAVVTPNGYLAGFDGEAPRGVTCTYQATCATYATSRADTEVATGPAILRSLTDPAASVLLGVDAYPDWTDGINQNVIRIVGRSDAIVTGDNVRWTGEGTLQGVTRDPATRAELFALLGTGGGPFLLQCSAQSQEPDVFVTVGTTKRSRWSQQSAQTRRNHELPLTVVARPPTAGSDVTVPGRTYRDLTGTWATQTADSYFDLGAPA